MHPKYVYAFEEGDGKNKQLLGGKGANLCEMTQIGLNVPPGFVLTTAACLKYQDTNSLPAGVMQDVKSHIRRLEKKAGKAFGSSTNPLLVSVRSGAAMSMPGMMDTVLNLGLNRDTLQGLIQQTQNERFGYDAYRRFIQLFGKVALGVPDTLFDEQFEDIKRHAGVKADVGLRASHLREISARFLHVVQQHTGQPFPEDVYAQLEIAIKTVFSSWMGKRAVDYRHEFHITPAMANGTAVNVVAMVFGNMGDDCATGVGFTRNPGTGKMNAAAMVRTSVEMFQEDLIGKEQALLRVNPSDLEQLLHPRLDIRGAHKPVAQGLPASPGAAGGQCVFDADRAEVLGRSGTKVILVREETRPEDIHGFFASEGILTSRGGKTSHAAVVARGMGKACVAGAEGIHIDIRVRVATVGEVTVHEGDVITIDGSTGNVYLGEIPTIPPQFSMVPQVVTERELVRVKQSVDEIQRHIETQFRRKLVFKFGSMIETVRACTRADKLAEVAEFFSFGTNDLTQATFSFSREDAENKFLPLYSASQLLPENPFEVLDVDGMGVLMQMAVEKGRQTNPLLKVGICGEHGGHPASIQFCHHIGLNYVSCSAPRVPIARLAAAHTTLLENKRTGEGSETQDDQYGARHDT